MKNTILSLFSTFCCILAVTALSGCSKTGIEGESALMRFSPQLPGTTRATDTAFEDGDAVGVYVTEYAADTPSVLQLSGNFGNNSSLVLKDGNWTLSPQIWWGEGKYDVYAYYPFDAQMSSVDEYGFEVKTDQNGRGYTGSDFMWTKNQGVTRIASVPLNFRHRLSRLDVEITKGEGYDGELPEDMQVRILNTNGSALIDLASGDVVPDPYGKTKTITAHKNDASHFSAIIVPQKLLSTVPLVEVLAGEVSYLVTTRFIFSEGTRHTMQIELSGNPSQVVINIGGGIEGWN